VSRLRETATYAGLAAAFIALSAAAFGLLIVFNRCTT